jgi:hypothetical protein
MSMERRWNDTELSLQYSDKTMSQCHLSVTYHMSDRLLWDQTRTSTVVPEVSSYTSS